MPGISNLFDGSTINEENTKFQISPGWTNKRLVNTALEEPNYVYTVEHRKIVVNISLISIWGSSSDSKQTQNCNPIMNWQQIKKKKYH